MKTVSSGTTIQLQDGHKRWMKGSNNAAGYGDECHRNVSALEQKF